MRTTKARWETVIRMTEFIDSPLGPSGRNDTSEPMLTHRLVHALLSCLMHSCSVSLIFQVLLTHTLANGLESLRLFHVYTVSKVGHFVTSVSMRKGLCAFSDGSNMRL